MVGMYRISSFQYIRPDIRYILNLWNMDCFYFSKLCVVCEWGRKKVHGKESFSVEKWLKICLFMDLFYFHFIERSKMIFFYIHSQVHKFVQVLKTSEKSRNLFKRSELFLGTCIISDSCYLVSFSLWWTFILIRLGEFWLVRISNARSFKKS